MHSFMNCLDRKYIPCSKGIAWYNFRSDQLSGFYGIVIPGTLRDPIFVLEGLVDGFRCLYIKKYLTKAINNLLNPA
jgi:TnpA family transposase